VSGGPPVAELLSRAARFSELQLEIRNYRPNRPHRPRSCKGPSREKLGITARQWFSGSLHVYFHAHPGMDAAFEEMLTLRKASDIEVATLKDSRPGHCDVFKAARALRNNTCHAAGVELRYESEPRELEDSQRTDAGIIAIRLPGFRSTPPSSPMSIVTDRRRTANDGRDVCKGGEPRPSGNAPEGSALECCAFGPELCSIRTNYPAAPWHFRWSGRTKRLRLAQPTARSRRTSFAGLSSRRAMSFEWRRWFTCRTRLVFAFLGMRRCLLARPSPSHSGSSLLSCSRTPSPYRDRSARRTPAYQSQ